MYQLQQQKKVIAGAVIAVLVLSLITVSTGGDFKLRKTDEDYAAKQAEFTKTLEQQRQEYQQYLNNLQIDPEASKLVFERVITEKDVQQIVETDLQVNQKINIPTIPQSELLVQGNGSKQVLTSYFENNFKATKQLSDELKDVTRNMYLFGVVSDQQIVSATQKAQEFVDRLYNTKVPKQAATYHSSQIVTYEGYIRQLKVASDFRNGANQSPWPSMYREYVIANDKAAVIGEQIRGLEAQYGIETLMHKIAGTTPDEDRPLLARIGLVKQAHALFGIGDFVFNFETASVYEVIGDAIGSAVGKYINTLLTGLINRLEKTFIVSNFLYYADAVVSGQYVPDYLDKYVDDPIDKDIIKRFIPQLNCGKKDIAGLQPLLTQKANEYLGVDVNNIDVSDGSFFEVMNRFGHTLSDEDGQSLDNTAKSIETVAEAEEAQQTELSSEGKKSGRGFETKNVVLSLSAIQSSQTASLIGQLALGTNNARNLVGKLVNSAIGALFSNFVFKTAAVVFKEQDKQACISGVPQLSAIIPGAGPATDPVVVDQGLIDRCKFDAQRCLDGVLGVNPPPPQLPPPQLPPDPPPPFDPQPPFQLPVQ